jgi:trans-2,3-dihydro-3-hydroxyanthranilate isomerase
MEPTALPKTLDFVQMDVFTSEPLQGNQLAVFTDARGLGDAEMQRIARETNLSETTFVFPRDEQTEAREGVHVRIFTTEEELPFAGHPTLGTAAVLRSMRNAGLVDLALKVGKIRVNFTKAEADLPYGEMRQNDPVFGSKHSFDEIAKIGGLSPHDIQADVPIQTVSTGNAFIIVPVRSLEAMSRLNFDQRRAQAYLDRSDGKFFYWICAEATSPEAQFHARMVFYHAEDPATGSAAGPAIAYLVRYGLAKSEERVVIEQGVEIKRRSHMFVSAKRDGERITDVRVGGYSVEIARGTYLLP